jgi:hypothetical protein
MFRIDASHVVHSLAFLSVMALVVAAPVLATTPDSFDLPELLEGFRTISPADQGVAVSGAKAHIGHLELELDEGTAYPLTGAGGEVLGFFFEGVGFYNYTTEFGADRRNFETNIRRHASGLQMRDNKVRDRFERLVLCFGTPILSEVWAQKGADPVPLPQGSADSFRKLWNRIIDTEVELDHLMAEARFNGDGLQHVWVEIPGDRVSVAYEMDAVRVFEEHLYTFQRYQGYELRFPRILSRQPIKAAETSPFAWNMHDIRIDVATDDNETGAINSELTLEAARGGLRVAPLSLMNNRDPYSYTWDSKKNALQVLRVTDESGNELPFSHRYHSLLVQLASSLAAGEQIKLRVETAGEVLTGLQGQKTDSYFELFSPSWYPQPLAYRWDATPYTFELHVKTRKPYTPIASGQTVSLSDEGDYYELVSRSTKPVERISLFAGKYKMKEADFQDLTVRVHAYAMSSKVMMKTLPGLASELVRFYSDHLGAYPFDELDVVEVPDYGFGIAPPGMVLLTSDVYKPRQDAITTYLSRGAPGLLAHEIAHQWFGHMVSPADATENWLSESFAEYLSGLAMGAGQTDERTVFGFKRMFAEWQADARRCADAGSLESASMLSGSEGYRDRRCLLYCRGPLVLHMLRSMVGDERFYAILRQFLKNANYNPTTTEDFKKAIKQVLRTDLDWFVDQWYEKAGIPEIRIQQRVEKAEGGGFVLTGRVEQDEGPGFMKILIPFVLTYPSGERELKLVFQEQPVQQFTLPVAGKPKSVKVDPGENNLAVYH